MASCLCHTSSKNDNLNVVQSRVCDFLKVLKKNNASPLISMTLGPGYEFAREAEYFSHLRVSDCGTSATHAPLDVSECTPGKKDFLQYSQ